MVWPLKNKNQLKSLSGNPAIHLMRKAVMDPWLSVPQLPVVWLGTYCSETSTGNPAILFPAFHSFLC